MKIVYANDGVWYFETGEKYLIPFKMVLQDTLNAGLEKRQYLVANKEEVGNFSVISIKDNSFEDHFSYMLVDLPEPETDPLILFYKVSNKELLEKFKDFLSTFHPRSLTLYFNKEEVTKENIISLIKSLKR